MRLFNPHLNQEIENSLRTEPSGNDARTHGLTVDSEVARLPYGLNATAYQSFTPA